MVLSPLISNIVTGHSGIDEVLMNFKLSPILKCWFTENKEERQVCQLNILRPLHIGAWRVGWINQNKKIDQVVDYGYFSRKLI